MCSNVDDFNNRNLFLTAKLSKQGYRYHKIRKAFSKFYHRHSELIVKYNIGLKTLLQQGISEPIFYGDLVYKFKRIVGKPNLSDQFKKIVKRYIRVGYNLDIMRQSACFVLKIVSEYDQEIPQSQTADNPVASRGRAAQARFIAMVSSLIARRWVRPQTL